MALWRNPYLLFVKCESPEYTLQAQSPSEPTRHWTTTIGRRLSCRGSEWCHRSIYLHDTT